MSRRTAALAVLPAVAGLVVAGVVLGASPRLTITVGASVALVAAVAGVLVSGVLVALLLGRARTARARRDAAEEAAAEERAAAAAAGRRLLRRLDHELKNPLTALLAALADGGEQPAARAQAQRIRGLLTDLRRIADVETAPLETATIAVEPVLRDAVELVSGDSGRPVRLDVPSAPWPPSVRADPDLLLVAVHNVVANAVKYSQPGDVVEVRARESGAGDARTVTIEVADTGPGIAEEDRAVVWEELARGHPPADVPGSGVGLALVRLIVERHGGTAELSSRVGTGTAVALHLPAVSPPGLPRTARPPR